VAWLVLALLATTSVDATLTIADCTIPGAEGIPSVSTDCAELEEWSARHTPPVRVLLPDSGALDAILADLGHAEKPMSLWEHFTGWLRDRFRDLFAALPAFPNPLRNLTLTWPDWLSRVLLWAGAGLLATLGIVALIAVYRSMHDKPLLPALRRAIEAFTPANNENQAVHRPTFADVTTAPPALRPRILLAITVGALQTAGRIDANATLSHRQLGPAVRGLTPGQRAAIESLARLAERVTYSCFVPDGVELAETTRVARDLVREVSP